MAERFEKPVAIVLGGTVPHIALIQRLKARGYHTVLVDYLENPPAREHADEHVKESTLDKDSVLALARDRQAKFVISAAVDQANKVASQVSEALGLPVAYGSDIADKVTNKGLMKTLLRDLGIPTAKHVRVTRAEEVHELGMELPLVVKPADTTGSKGVRLAGNMDELAAHVTDALALSRAGEVIVEEYIEGTEVQFDYFVVEGVAHRIMMREKMPLYDGGRRVFQSVGSIVHEEFPPAVVSALDDIAQRLAIALKLRNTALFIQAIVRDQQVHVIEFALRIGGGLSFSMIQRITGFDVMEAIVDVLFGSQPSMVLSKNKYFYGTCLLYSERMGRLGCIDSLDEIKSNGLVEESYVFKSKNSVIGQEFISSDRVAAFLVKASSRSELLSLMMKALNFVDIVDDKNCSCIHLESFRMFFSKNVQIA